MENHYLLSANSCQGFKNHFESIVSKENFTYILKGGAGTGKSTFMKKIGEHFKNLGYDIEYFYCSSDKDSLDGVRILGKNVCIVDGTSPHVTEATMPGVLERIINIGDFIKEDIKKYREEISILLLKKSHCFTKAYAYLKCAGELFNAEKLEFENVKTQLQNPIIDLENLKEKGRERKLFLDYISSSGISSLLEKNSFENIINLNAKNYFLGQNFLDDLANKLTLKGIKFTSFISLFDGESRAGVYIPETKTLVLNNIEENSFKNYRLLNLLLKKAGRNLDYAKSYHKKIESFYISCMDFEGIDKLREKITKKIEEM